MNQPTESVSSFENSPKCQTLICDPAAFSLVEFPHKEWGLQDPLEGIDEREFSGTALCDSRETARTQGHVAELGSLRSEMIAAGMADPGEVPTDDHIRRYFLYFAPVRDLVREMRFAEAATVYRWLAMGAGNPALHDRYLVTARQLDFAQQMQRLCHSPLSFPPTGEQVELYFEALTDSRVDGIRSAFEEYVDSFFILPETVSSEKDINRPACSVVPEWCTEIPAGWDVVQGGQLREDGRRMLDPVVHALLGQKCLAAAGFSRGCFAVASRRDSAGQADSLSTCLMFSASRAFGESRRWIAGTHVEVVVVANGSLQWAATHGPAEMEAAEELLFWSAFQKALGASLEQAGRVAEERIVRIGRRQQAFKPVSAEPTRVRVVVCYPTQQGSEGKR